jgi:hypothetical protein
MLKIRVNKRWEFAPMTFVKNVMLPVLFLVAILLLAGEINDQPAWLYIIATLFK